MMMLGRAANYHHGEKKPVTAQFKKPDESIFHGNYSRIFAGQSDI
jgi:hypothetical protein